MAPVGNILIIHQACGVCVCVWIWEDTRFRLRTTEATFCGLLPLRMGAICSNFSVFFSSLNSYHPSGRSSVCFFKRENSIPALLGGACERKRAHAHHGVYSSAVGTNAVGRVLINCQTIGIVHRRTTAPPPAGCGVNGWSAVGREGTG